MHIHTYAETYVHIYIYTYRRDATRAKEAADAAAKVKTIKFAITLIFIIYIF
jgi:hypothetical protein